MELLPASGLFWALRLPILGLKEGEVTGLRLWWRPRDRQRARPWSPLSPVSLSEARIQRKASLELRVRLALGFGEALASR